MSNLDVMLVAAILVVALCRIVAPRWTAAWRTLACLALGALCLVQLGIEGFYWQFLSAYGLLAATALPALRAGRLGSMLGNTAFVVLGAAAVAPWALLPVPRLPPPGGPYSVGSQVFRWVDDARPETATNDPSDHRNVVAQAWYPVAAQTRGAHAAYLDGLGQLPQSVAGLPRFIFRHFDRVDTHAISGAPISNARAAWPLVVFSPGYGAPRAFYTGLVTAIASRGYVVLALDHPYEAAVTQLADGRVVGPQQAAGRSQSDGSGHMANQIEVRVADIDFILDRAVKSGGLGPKLSPRVDPRRIGAIGHSFGGATALLAMERDSRILAAADVDGFLWGAFSGRPPRGPVLILESDHPDTAGSRAFVARTLEIVGRAPHGSFRYRIMGTNHFSFTDPPLYFSRPGQFALGRVLGGARSAAETQQATADLLSAFLGESLTGATGDVPGVAETHGQISGGPVGAGDRLAGARSPHLDK